MSGALNDNSASPKPIGTSGPSATRLAECVCGFVVNWIRWLDGATAAVIAVSRRGPLIRSRVAWSIAAAMVLLTSVPATAAEAPAGFQLMCFKTPAECRGGGKSVIVATDDVRRILKIVNIEVNRSIRSRPDGAMDVWSVGVSAGDCEDYVLAKRHSLMRAGLPASALRIASVKTRGGEAHAILVVKTTTGDVVLDNLQNAIQPLSDTGYRVVSVSTANPRVWR